MEKIVIKTGDSVSEILVGAGWEMVHELLPESGVAILTDRNIFRIYGDKFPDFPVFQVDAGEASKKIRVVESLAGELLETGIDRDGIILGIGGGVVCDLAGFLASIYMRGIRCAYVSTSLLSQVDASTGGKNGVNLDGAKNVLGCFKQPEFVICDPEMLETLTEEEYHSGLAELIKTALIGDRKLFELIENNRAGISRRDPGLLSMCISMAVNFKAAVVTEDERETGLRRLLNFGHTYGHAIEMYKSYRHGYAVAAGMELASRFSLSRGMITREEFERIKDLLNSYGLLPGHDIPDDEIIHLIMKDKKKSGNDISFVFLNGIGKAVAEKITVKEAAEFYIQSKTDK
ncbi:MAG: 3-dehydroquinate synthase [Bacteroidales bacterium]|nr:3-dehydroquinate synthase [Bacteroidales bacterium]